MQTLLLLSGSLAVGKSTLAQELVDAVGFYQIRTGGFLEQEAAKRGEKPTRELLRKLGDDLDDQTDFKWVIDVAKNALSHRSNVNLWLFDSVRKERQIEHFRSAFGDRVYHVHLRAEEDVLKSRYESRQKSGMSRDEGVSYDDAILHPNEIAARALNKLANLEVDLGKVTPEEAAAIILRATKRLPELNPRKIVLLSGRTGSGKSSVAEALSKEFDFHLLQTGKLIGRFARENERSDDRLSLQDLGDTLDRQTNHAWLLEAVSDAHAQLPRGVPIVLDNVRNAQQLDRFRRRRDWQITHIHLYATRKTLATRFADQRKQDPNEVAQTYEEFDLIKKEEDIDRFKLDADIRISTTSSDTRDTLVRIGARLGLYPPPDIRCVDVLVGGQYGSEGKGHIAAYLASEYDVLVRVGGPNAGHTVASASGLYTYHQLPSGARDTNAKLLLGPGMTIRVEELLQEIQDCGVTEERLFIDPQAMIIEREDIEAEQGIKKTIASTGRGGGAAAARRIMKREEGAVRLAKDVPELSKYVGDSAPYRGSTTKQLENAYRQGMTILLEGTQGSGLSLYHGYYPHVTSRDTNVAGCLAEAGISPSRIRRILMVIRPMPIRVGNPDGGVGTSGFLKHETTFTEIATAAQLDPIEVNASEITSTTKRNRRVGHFDWEQFRKACALNAPTDIVLTFADYLHAKNRDARRLEQLDEKTIRFIEEIERVAQAPVSLINTRFPKTRIERIDLRTVIDRRNWYAGRREQFAKSVH